MKYKNILFIVCTSLMLTSELCSMHLIPKRLSVIRTVNTRYPTIQKRFDSGFETVILGVVISASCLVAGIYFVKICNGIIKIKNVMKSERAAYKYVHQKDSCYTEQIPSRHPWPRIGGDCGDCICTKNKTDAAFLESIDNKWPNRLKCLQDLQKKYKQCDFVEDDKIRIFWAAAKNFTAGDLKTYRTADGLRTYYDDFKLITHRKQCLYSATMRIKNDIPHF